MTKQTYKEYVAEGILVNIQKPIYGKNRSAIIKCDGHSTPTKKFPIEIEVSAYYPQPLYNLK